MSLVILAIFYVFAPMLILHLAHKYPFVNKLGAVFVAYFFGLILGNIGILPEGSVKVQDLMTTITIPLAIPLLLFSSNFKQWGKVARVTFISLFIGIFSVVLVVVLGFFLFKGKGMPELWKVAGMLIGVYTGGTPNLASLKMMLNVDADTYILTHTYDLIISSVYIVFLITLGKRVFHWFLKPFPTQPNAEIVGDTNGSDPFAGVLRWAKLKPLFAALGLAVLIFGIGGGLSLLVPKSQQMVVVILTITTLGIAASFVPAVNRIEHTFEAGMYLILVFSIVVASMADISNFAGITPGLFGYITFAVFLSLILHVLLAKLTGVDADTVMITSVSLICSPPFVPVIAGAIGNKQVIVSGLTVGIIGYAVGNYLGYFIAEVLKNFM
ncbi:MAG TPA: DUF819 family protein [Tenuifilaceae bacterium]|nr:DUF819 family protein [Tenuifilaceae bacterium]